MSARRAVRRGAIAVVATLFGTLLVSGGAQALTPGWLDSSYAGGFPVGLDNPPVAAAVDSSGRALAAYLAGGTTVARLAVDGGLDAGFGSGGTVVLPAGPSYTAMLVGSDGIYVAGVPSSGNGVLIARLTPAGVVDASYGSGGLARVNIPTTIGEVLDLTQLDSGDLVVAAAHDPAPRADYLAAVTSSGSLDPTWNATGTTPGVRPVAERVVSVTHVANLTGVSGLASTGATRVRQLTATGAPDASFGSSGVLTLPASFSGNGIDAGSDGKYYVAGISGTSTTAPLAVARILSSNGTLDGSFGISGVGRVSTGDAFSGSLTVTVGGFVYVFGGGVIARLTSAGAADLSYGSGGILTGFPRPVNTIGVGLVSGGVQPTGKAVVVGRTSDDDGFQTPVAFRVNAVTSAPAGSFVALPPVRVLDTRTGTGAPKAAVGPGMSVSLQVGAGASAVVMTVTAVSPTRSGFVTVYPSGTARPTASNLNHPAGATTPNLVTVAPGPDGKVILYNGSSGSVHLVADLLGYYLGGAASVPGAFASLPPARILDTRNGTGAPLQQVPAGGTLTLTAAGAGGVPATGVSAVVLNATVTRQIASGYLTIYPSGSVRPNVSNLNFYPGQPRANLATVRLGSTGALNLYNASTGPVDLVADIAGYYLDGTPTASGTFVAIDPVRLMDTRAFTNPHGISAHGTLVVASRFLPYPGNSAYVINATVTRTSEPGFATYRGGSTRGPFDTSTVNFAAGQTTASLTVTAGAGFVVYNGSPGTIHAIADLAGYFLP